MSRCEHAALLCCLLCPLILGLFASTPAAMPLHPDVVEKLRAEDRLEAEARFMEEAYTRGVNKAPGLKAVVQQRPLEGLPVNWTVQRNAIVILADFSDKVADTVQHPSSHYASLLFSDGTYPTGSMRDFYLENSYGEFALSGSATRWFRMPQTYAYYVNGQRGLGAYPQNAQKLTEDAILAADPYVDFSQFDNDGPDGLPHSGDDDGYVDALFVVHAGPGYEETGNVNDIHSHQWNTKTAISVDGVLARVYSMEPENGKIGVFCHEYGHVLGLPDLYDYEYDSRGVGFWSLMAGGSWGNSGLTPVHLDAWSKSKLGFVTPTVLTSNTDSLAVPPAATSPVSYIIWTNGVYSNEYFIAENRQPVLFDSYIKGPGLVVYHVDETALSNQYQCCGICTYHSIVAVKQADGECDLEYNYNSGDPGDPFPGAGGVYNPNMVFDSLSTPSSRNYLGTDTQVSISNISLRADSVVADFVVETVPLIELTNRSVDEISAGSNSNFIVDPGETVNLFVELRNHGIAAPDAGVRISESDPYVTLLGDTAFYGTIGEDVSTVPAPFVFSIDPACPIPHGIVFDALIRDSRGYSVSRRFFVGVSDTVGFYDWTHGPVTAKYNDQWHLSTNKNHTTGDYSSWKCGSTSITGVYLNLLDASLYTASFYCGPGTRLTFWHMMDAEYKVGTFGAWDGGVVDISVEGGPWQRITPASGYPYVTLSSPDSPFPVGTACFSGSSSVWKYVEFDLSGYTGRAKIRFRFGSDGAIGRKGWYIDDM
ncbi:MAG: M6 family metalloprotease domain-containing protein, partial [Candidatus Eisenbacteria bacterium]